MPCGSTVTHRASSPRSHEPIGRPSSSTRPAAGDSMPETTRSKVLLPLPFAPSTTTCSPSASSRSIPRSTVRPSAALPYRAETPESRTTASAIGTDRAPQEPEEERCADECGHDADGDASREPRPEVGNEEEQRAVDHARRKEQPMV